MPAQGTPTPPLVGGNSAVQQVLEGYVFQSGILKPEHSNILTLKYPQYYATSLLDRLGASEGISQTVWSWNILDRTRESGTVAALGALGATTTTFDTAFDYTADQPGYLLVGDVIRLQSGVLGEVTAVANNGAGKEQVTVRKVGGGNWAAGDIADGNVWGHSHTMFPEGSSAPQYRVYLPTEEWNSLTTLRRSIKITGTAFTDRTYIGDGKSWYFAIEDIEMKEFAKDREMAIMFGVRENESTKSSTRGIWDYVSTYGVVNGFAAGSLSETDVQNHIADLVKEGGSSELVVLAGSDFYVEFQRAMKAYVLNGGVDYGRFGKQLVGLDIVTYRFFGKTIHLAYYELFDDDKIVPYSGAASSSLVKFSNTSLWLDLGTDDGGKKLITLKHKELNGTSRKFIHGHEAGMISADGSVGGEVANGDDAFKVHYLSEIGVEVRLPNRQGILRATS